VREEAKEGAEQEWGEEGEPPAGKKKEKKKKAAPKERDPKRAKYTEQGRVPNLCLPFFIRPFCTLVVSRPSAYTRACYKHHVLSHVCKIYHIW
jgi:hypothetical protein